MPKQPIVFFTFVSDNYYEPVGTPLLSNSFKKFHPEIPLVVFRDDVIKQVIDSKEKFMDGRVNWLNAKPVFAKLLTDKYEMVVNIDADSVVLGRLDEVLTEDYDIGSVMNQNDFESVSVDNITEEMYLQAGFIACRTPEFWDSWMQLSLKDNWRMKCAENDTMNLVIYNQYVPAGYKLKVFDEKGYMGCKVLGRESECIIEDEKVMCRGEQVKVYHSAKGPGNMPKLTPEKLKEYGFKDEVIGFIHAAGTFGTTQLFGNHKDLE